MAVTETEDWSRWPCVVTRLGGGESGSSPTGPGTRSNEKVWQLRADPNRSQLLLKWGVGGGGKQRE